MSCRAFVDMNDRDESGRIRIGKSPSIVDDQGKAVAPREGLEVAAYDNSMTVPGILALDGDRWFVAAAWNEAVHND